MDGKDQPKIYTIRDHTLEVLMHPDVLELHAVRVVHTPHGDERQLHLKVRVRCGQEELVVDVLVDTVAQVSLVGRGLFKEESLQPSRRPVRLKVANGEIMGGGTHEATISMEFWEPERPLGGFEPWIVVVPSILWLVCAQTLLSIHRIVSQDEEHT